MRKYTIKFGSKESIDWGKPLTCPLCKNDYIHLNKPKACSGDDYECWKSGRGSLISQVMWCEAGHSWSLNFGFHKGKVYTYLSDIKVEGLREDAI